MRNEPYGVAGSSKPTGRNNPIQQNSEIIIDPHERQLRDMVKNPAAYGMSNSECHEFFRSGKKDAIKAFGKLNTKEIKKQIALEKNTLGPKDTLTSRYKARQNVKLYEELYQECKERGYPPAKKDGMFKKFFKKLIGASTNPF